MICIALLCYFCCFFSFRSGLFLQSCLQPNVDQRECALTWQVLKNGQLQELRHQRKSWGTKTPRLFTSASLLVDYGLPHQKMSFKKKLILPGLSLLVISFLHHSTNCFSMPWDRRAQNSFNTLGSSNKKHIIMKTDENIIFSYFFHGKGRPLSQETCQKRLSTFAAFLLHPDPPAQPERLRGSPSAVDKNINQPYVRTWKMIPNINHKNINC